MLNGHAFPVEIPPEATVWNFENVGVQLNPESFGSVFQLWDFSVRNVSRWRRPVRHVPVGYHPSMDRFERAKTLDIDVVHLGAMNDRRQRVLDDLSSRGLKVVNIPHGVYGAERDAILARSKLALNLLFYEDGVFPALRAAHLIANRVPLLSEEATEVGMWPTMRETYMDMANRAADLLKEADRLPELADARLARFKALPLVLPC